MQINQQNQFNQPQPSGTFNQNFQKFPNALGFKNGHESNHPSFQQQKNMNGNMKRFQNAPQEKAVISCDACQMIFKRKDQYDNHVKNHIKCKYCAFNGLKQVVVFHELNIHIE